MENKKTFAFLLGIVFFVFLFSPTHAQMKTVSKFRNVVIPIVLKHEDHVLERGKYDLEIMRDVTTHVYFLRIYKGGKAICNVAGEEQSYGTWDQRSLLMNPNIPDDAKLRFKKVPEEKIVNLIFESGKRAGRYPCVMVKFQMQYE